MKPNLYYYDYTNSTLYAPKPFKIDLPDWCESIKVDDFIYFIGGYLSSEKNSEKELYGDIKEEDSEGEYSFSSLMMAFNVKTGETIKKSPFKIARTGHSLVRIGSTIFMIGGYNGSALSSCEAYDIMADSWKPISDLTHKKYSSASVAIGTKIYNVGGFNTTYLNSIEKYESDEWKSVAILEDELTRVSKHYCLELNENTILILGGKSKLGVSNQCYIYDIAAGKIAPSSEIIIGDVFEWGSNSDGLSVVSRNGNIHSFIDGKWAIILKENWIATA
jgi:hypothetical protein